MVSGPEFFLIACGRAAFLIMSLSISPYESHYFANDLFCTAWTILRMCSINRNSIMR